jgi:dihydropteroate synthase
MKWLASKYEYSFPRPTLVMGVLNVTPDSFSDGGRFLDPGAARARALSMIEAGSDLIDVGGESTRPGAETVAESEELRRVMPVLEKLAGEVSVPLSIDTAKAGVARAALGAGASIVNDVGAARAGREMWELVAESGAGYVAMHMRGTPQTMQQNPVYHDVQVEVDGFFGAVLGRLGEAGVRPDQVVLDVGIGFGKRLEHNLQLMAGLKGFKKWERPLLLGASRKSFIGQVTGVMEPEDRLPGSLACACLAVQAGVQIIRTHDVAATRQVLRLTEAVMACRS